MKIRISTTVSMLMLLLLCVFAVGLAQNTKPNEGQKQIKDVTTMESCCCVARQSDPTTAGEKSDGQNSCCCCNESCDMKMENMSMKDHATANSCCCCDGDSCDMGKMDAKANHSKKHECCCNGRSCDMKTEGQMSHSTTASCCNMKMKHESLKGEKPKP